MTAGLTTHVLDTSQEGPAEGVPVTLYRVEDEAEPIASGVTNDDGRLDEPLLGPDEMVEGSYELQFDVDDYYGSKTSFLETVPVRFIIAEPDEHYHVPLLLSPGGYTTYRGS